MKVIAEVMPMVASATRMLRPRLQPSTVRSAARVPWAVPLAMHSDMFGPGVTASTRQARTKAT